MRMLCVQVVVVSSLLLGTGLAGWSHFPHGLRSEMPSLLHTRGSGPVPHTFAGVGPFFLKRLMPKNTI